MGAQRQSGKEVLGKGSDGQETPTHRTQDSTGWEEMPRDMTVGPPTVEQLDADGGGALKHQQKRSRRKTCQQHLAGDGRRGHRAGPVEMCGPGRQMTMARSDCKDSD